MSKKEQLPAEVHDHFRKANVLHTYVQESLGEATKHALETGQELLAAKAAVPHGRWEDECKRLFNGSASCARFYMQFAKNMEALPKRQRSAICMLEGSLKGAADAAKKAANPPKPNTPRKDAAPASVTTEPEPASGEDDADGTDAQEPAPEPPRNGTDKPGDYGRCPNCHGTEWLVEDDGVCCAKCLHPCGEPAGDVDDDVLTKQRQKTIKTAEALHRAFEDLNAMLARAENDEAGKLCKRLLVIAKGWK